MRLPGDRWSLGKREDAMQIVIEVPDTFLRYPGFEARSRHDAMLEGEEGKQNGVYQKRLSEGNRLARID